MYHEDDGGVCIDGSRAVVVWILAKVLKNVNVTTIMFLMSGDLTGLCLCMYVCTIEENSKLINLFSLSGFELRLLDPEPDDTPMCHGDTRFSLKA